MNIEQAMQSELASRTAALSRLLATRGSAFGFECRLADGASQLDVGISVSLPEGPQIVAGLCAGGEPQWRNIEAFARRWADPGSILHRRIPFVFLEFDGDVAGELLPVPSVFVSLDWPLNDEPKAFDGNTDDLKVISTALGSLTGGALHASTTARLAQCFAALPVGGRVLHAGAMLGRAGDAVRLSVALRRSDLLAYLRQIGWHRPSIEIAADLERFAPGLPRVHLEIDVGSTIGARIGVVVSFPRSLGASQEWSQLFERLVEHSLCAPEKRDAILAWPAVGAEGLYANDLFVPLRRDWSHVKLSYSPGEATEAKAYLTVRAQL